MTTAGSQKRGKSQRGGALMEGTAVTLLLFGLLFLVVDLALALFTKATLQAAVRAGVRLAVTEQLGSNLYLNDAITQTVQQNALGILNGTNGACKIAINYYNPITGQADTGTGGDVVEVSIVGYKYQPVGILKSSSPVTISASSSDVMEQCPFAGCPTVANPQPATCP
jgi:Flp pilus assembly protein TadG